MRFLHEGSVWLEYLDAVIHAVADEQRASDGQIGTMPWIAELLSRGRNRIVVAEVGVIRFVAISAPMPLVIASVRVEHDGTMIALAACGIHFIRLFVDERLGRQPGVLDVVATFARVGLSDLHQKLTVPHEFENHVLIVESGRRNSRFVRRASRATATTPRQKILPGAS